MAEEKITSTLRLRMSAKDAHYGGELVDGAHMVHLFGDVATELLIKLDGDEGLFCAYDNVEFLLLPMQVTISKLTAKSTESATLPGTWYSKQERSSFPEKTSTLPLLTSLRNPSLLQELPELA